jgi:CheY-like chemotaxis protein
MSDKTPEPGTLGSILLVDDEEAIRQVLSLALEMEGYKIFTAANGKEGLAALSRIPRPFLILLDLMMPVMDGWDFLAALRKNPAYATIPVVVITAFAGETGSTPGIETFKKPVELNQIFATVRKYSRQASDFDRSPIELAG